MPIYAYPPDRTWPGHAHRRARGAGRSHPGPAGRRGAGAPAGAARLACRLVACVLSSGQRVETLFAAPSATAVYLSHLFMSIGIAYCTTTGTGRKAVLVSR